MMGFAQRNVPITDTDYFTFHFATLKDSWPVKTNLSISNNLSTFSHAVSNFFIMDGIRTANAFTIIYGHHFTSHLYFVSHTGSTLHLISTVIILEMFPSEKNPLVVLNSFFSNRLASFLCPSFMNFRFWIQHQYLPEIFHTLFDSSRLMHEFQFSTFPDSTDRAFSIPESNNPVQDI